MSSYQDKKENYQITITEDIDFLQVIKFLNKKNNPDETLTKQYIHSLFTPLLSYIIDYLNNNDEKILVIGRGQIQNLKVVYSILNKEIYNLFFKRKKGKVFDGKEDINYDIEPEKENYYICFKKKDENISKEKQYLEKIFHQEIYDNDEQLINSVSLEDILELKKKEIISMYKFGYSIQERIINLLNAKSNNSIIELPNIIFYEKNDYYKLYNEFDRILTVEKDTKVSNFQVYLKAVFKKRKPVSITKIQNGETLSLNANSCNFIEVKTSTKYLLGEEKKEKEVNKADNKSNDIKYGSVSSISSQYSGVKKDNNDFNHKIYKNMTAFIELFQNLKKYFIEINLIIIIDSIFPKNFLFFAEKFATNFVKESSFNFNLFFVHIEPDIEYVHIIDEFENINKNLNEKEEKIKNQEEKIKNQEEKIKNQEEKIKNLVKDSKDKENKIKNQEDEINNLKKDSKESRLKIGTLTEKIYEFEKKSKIKKEKKNIQKEIIKSDIILKEINKFDIKNTKKEENLIIGEFQNPNFTTLSKLFKINKKDYNIIIDSQSFCKLSYKKENNEFIEIIKKKHFDKLKQYTLIGNIKSLVLIVDFVFILNIKEIMETYFENKNVVINPVLNHLFILNFNDNFNNKDNFPKENEIIFSDDIFAKLVTNKMNLIAFKDISNFINYYFETKNLDYNNVVKFPLYNPLTNGTDFYITIKVTEQKNEKLLIMTVDPIYEYDDLFLDFEKEYRYILIIYKTHYIKVEEDTLEKISNFFFKELKYETETGEIQDDEKIIFENSSKSIKLYEEKYKAFILDKNEQRLQCQFKGIMDKKTFRIDINEITDKNILNIIKAIPKFRNDKKINVLIEEPFNIIYKYLKSIYNNGNFVLLSDEKNNEIKEFISTKESNEINNINLFSYIISQKNKEYFDIIILENNCFPDNKNDIIPKTLFEGPNLKNIRDHLTEGGIFCFHLLLKNKYLKENVKAKLEKYFNHVKILSTYELDNIVVCS